MQVRFQLIIDGCLDFLVDVSPVTGIGSNFKNGQKAFS